ncbi:VEF-1 [Buzura suppressaria nucleopolyhedrovirus]|uniref:VEF-1 n=1 Tax=Buzura suppressaria nuclear polyhedrosis virus TaxID=74320 RepID=W5VKI6_NPVBS|nr:VEF-1 [Buzura suppressaria nucleopolyhedrovirus]AHH82623.1 VEF-1 [Buzura suppressaria nucleopolyhedrovirus]
MFIQRCRQNPKAAEQAPLQHSLLYLQFRPSGVHALAYSTAPINTAEIITKMIVLICIIIK